MGLYEVENIDNPNICTIAVNPKEYFEKIKNRSMSKRQRWEKTQKECVLMHMQKGLLPWPKNKPKENGWKKIPGKKYRNEDDICQ